MKEVLAKKGVRLSMGSVNGMVFPSVDAGAISVGIRGSPSPRLHKMVAEVRPERKKTHLASEKCPSILR